MKKGFTLIELLVVIAIISLLSSVVLAGIRDAREKAKATAFRQEIGEFVKALELYRIDNGRYPGEPFTSFSYSTRLNSLPVNTNLSNFTTIMEPYIKKIPVAPTSDVYFWYFYNGTLRCVGDERASPYTILVQSTQRGFEDWPYYTNSVVGDSPIIPNTLFRCFSI
jgi:type II secretion system protein G